MKKMFMMAMAFCAMQVSMADNENLLQVLPLHIAVNQEVNYDEDDALLKVYLNSESVGSGVEFDIYIPDVLDFDPEDINLESEVVPYKGKNPRYHTTYQAVYADKYQDKPGYTRIAYKIYDSTLHDFSAAEGVVCSFNVGTTNATPGVYPVYLGKQDILDKESAHIGSNFGAMTAGYIVVGEPTAAELKLTDIVPSKVNEALEKETAISSLDLSGVTKLNGFSYTVGKAVTAPAITADVKVVAGLNGGQYGSLCSPVALPGVKCYKFTTAADGIATFTEVDDVPANEVVIIDAAVNAKVAGASLVSVANGTADAGRLYVAPDGSELRRAKNSVTVPALRGTWDIAGGSNLRIALDTPTGIKMIGTANEVFGNTYDLQGRQVENAQNGVYVVNGKKQFVK